MRGQFLSKYMKLARDGFTTIEIAIVVIISGILISIFLNGYTLYTQQKDYALTLENIEELNGALNQFRQEFSRYPCPADPTLPPDHPDFGRETQCGPISLGAISGDCASGGRPLLVQTTFDTGINTESNVICSGNDARDVNGDGNSEYVLTGVIPFRTLTEFASNSGGFIQNYREFMSIDGYDMRFTYAVTEIMADSARNETNPVNPQMGSIRVVDENGTDITIPPRTAHYVLISHGANKRGAYSEFGVQAEDCDFSSFSLNTNGLDDPFDPVIIAGGSGLDLEIENCDQVIEPNPDDVDAIFRLALRSNNDTNPAFFDDIVSFRSFFATNLWQPTSSTGGLTGQRFLYNTNIGNVGVGEEFTAANGPASKLHVLGDVVINDDNPAAGTSTPIIKSEGGFCDSDKRPLNTFDAVTNPTPDLSECMQPSTIVGAGDSCGDGEVAVGFDRNQLICEEMFLAGATVNFDCGFDTTDADGDGDTTEALFPTGIVYDRTVGAGGAITALNCIPL